MGRQGNKTSDLEVLLISDAFLNKRISPYGHHTPDAHRAKILAYATEQHKKRFTSMYIVCMCENAATLSFPFCVQFAL